MKYRYVFSVLFLVGILQGSILAQTGSQLTELQQQNNTALLQALQNRYDAQYRADMARVEEYLKAHPEVKRFFEKDKSVYELVRIDAQGNPVYINTKNKASGELIKANTLYSGGSVGVDITGTGMVAGVWDGGQVRSTHELLTGKVTMQANQVLDSKGGNNHMTHVSGTIVGKDITNQPSARGIAYNATAKCYDWDNDLAEMAAFAAEGFLISNHSYGYSNDSTVDVWKFGAYDETSKNWDLLLKNAPNYLPFVAGGNEQQSSGNKDKAGYDLMTGSSSSKNVITVGAVNGDRAMSDYSNWGPTDDGRIKPDICAKGTGINSSQFTDSTGTPSDVAYSGNGESSSGTSYATPAVAASALLLQQYHHSLYGSYMSAALLKALLLHTADDAGNPGPDSKFGWGIANIEAAANIIKAKASGHSVIETVTTNPANNGTEETTHTYTTVGGEPVKVSICWTDDEGAEQVNTDGIDPTASRLVYNFDFLVKESNASNEARPWKGPGMANRTGNATITTTWFENTVDNYKQAILNSPQADATATLNVRKSSTSPQTTRPYALVISGIKPATTSGVDDDANTSVIAFYDNQNSAIKFITNQPLASDLYTIYDITGRLVQSGSMSNQQVNIQFTQHGTFIFKLSDGKTALTFNK